MIILASPHGFTVTELDDFGAFHVDAAGLTLDELRAQIVADPRPGELDLSAGDAEPHLWVPVSYLDEQYADDADESRRLGLAKMLAYAASRGWVDSSGERVRAHITNLEEAA